MNWAAGFLYWPALRKKEWVITAVIDLLPVTNIRMVRSNGQVTTLPRYAQLVLLDFTGGQTRVRWVGQTRSRLTFIQDDREILPPRGEPPQPTEYHLMAVNQ